MFGYRVLNLSPVVPPPPKDFQASELGGEDTSHLHSQTPVRVCSGRTRHVDPESQSMCWSFDNGMVTVPYEGGSKSLRYGAAFGIVRIDQPRLREEYQSSPTAIGTWTSGCAPGTAKAVLVLRCRPQQSHWVREGRPACAGRTITI